MPVDDQAVDLIGMTPARRPARRETLRDLVRSTVTQRIMDGTYAPGERIIEMRLAEELGTSQGPVREAIRDLASMRLITHEPYRGARVLDITNHELAAAIPVRVQLEVLAVRLGMARLAEDVEPLRSRLEAMRAAAGEDDRYAFAANDAGFHGALVDAADNHVLRDAWDVTGAARLVLVTATRLDLDLAELAEAHVPILSAYEAGDAERAAGELKVHLPRYHVDAVAGLDSAG